MRLKELSVSDLGQVVTGKTPSTNNPAFFDGDYQFVTPSDLDWKTYYCQSTERTVTENARKILHNQFIPANTVMVTCIGNTIGKCGLSSGNCLTNQQINSVIPSDGIDPRFVYYLLVHNIETIRGVGLGGGSATPILNKTSFSKIKLRVPPSRQWSSISNILSAYDDLIENNRRRIQLLEQAARLLYKEWFVHLRFPGHEHTKIIDGVPKGWKKKPLGDLLTLQRGFDLPVSKRQEGLIPIYASTGINGYHIAEKVNGPGVVTGRSGSLGTVMYVPGDFWPLNTTLWVKEFKLVGPLFATHLLMSMHLEQYNGGAAVPTLNRNDVHRIEVLCPLQLLLTLFDEYAKEIADQIDTLEKMSSKLSYARDLLLPKLMNGEVAV
ncbi:MAG: restriction endonuclease subunit S [Syntrophotalea acetylenica]|nr:restriction endonuclease subunit S [Syntrophotalea acetylenica]